MSIIVQIRNVRNQYRFIHWGAPRAHIICFVDELRERRARGLQKKIDALALFIAKLVVAVERVEKDNAELSASLKRSRFRVVKGRGE